MRYLVVFVANILFCQGTFVDLIQKDTVQDVLFSVTDGKSAHLKANGEIHVYNLKSYSVQTVLNTSSPVFGMHVLNNSLLVHTKKSDSLHELILYRDDYTTQESLSVHASSLDISIQEERLLLLVNRTHILVYDGMDTTLNLIQTIVTSARSIASEDKYLVLCDIGKLQLYRFKNQVYSVIISIDKFDATYGVSQMICHDIAMYVHTDTLEDNFVDVFVPDIYRQGGMHFIQFIGQEWIYHQRVYGQKTDGAMGQQVALSYPYVILSSPTLYSNHGGWELYDCSGLCTLVDSYLEEGLHKEIGDVVGITSDHVLVSGNTQYFTRVYEIFEDNHITCPVDTYAVESLCKPCSELKSHFNELQCCKLQSTSHQNKVCEELGVPCKVCEYIWEQFHETCNSCRSTTTCELDQDCLSKNCDNGTCV